MSETLTSKTRLAEAINEGLKHVRENHEIFVIYDSDNQVYGCALAIAAVGLSHLLGDDVPEGSLEPKGMEFSPGLVDYLNRISAGKIISDFAFYLGIDHNLASKLDVLHRQERIPAAKIAEMLLSDQV